ncbi:protein translocase subunit SecDF [Spirosoma utsteinense]|uniref:Multifunctional fusion protein n=1 Tax=Spirosoma utsteinense TaxID=2585773 RepID=A0ABR6W0R0_9BACT|nr:protein translocase subunit SecDF [Spirosoma utsteinense]MBC3783732.1 SecD/SecF fusion protein [Spirosoma utsteinense]MBC3790125.1 SecD/SecF fusion protein [Spirosoma utsteinense]
MQNRTGILILTGVITAICLYFLSFTFVSRSIKSDAEAFATSKSGEVDRSKKQRYLDSLWKEPVFLGSTLQEVSERELGLGLDLQGGMHVVLEVSPADVLRSLSGNNRDPKFSQALKQANEDKKTSNTSYVDLFVSNFKELAPDTKLATIFATSANRGKINYQSSDTEVRKMLNDEVNGAITRAFQIIQARVDKFGVANPNIQRLPGSGRIQIELPGVDNPERVRRLLTGAAKLEFTEVYRLNELAPALEGMGAYLVSQEAARKAALGTAGKTTAPTGGTAATGTSLESQLAQGNKTDSTGAKDTAAASAQGTALTQLFLPVGQDQLGVYLKDTARANAVLNAPEVRGQFPADAFFAWDRKTFKATDGKEILPLYFLKKPAGRAPLEGDVITDAANDYDDRGRPEVTMNMNAEGARKWKNLTAANVGRPVAILLDNLVYTAPNVQNEIPNGRSSISGNFTVEETKDMSNVLKAGKLPAPTNIVEESIVGATLGSEAVQAGVLSSVIGILLVLAFVVFYYNRAGLIADLALIINLFFLLGVMASLGAVLTMPGIAGIVLSIGMAVDANVLIFERIKEELAEGKGFKQAVGDGFKNALSSIIDSNVTTFLTGIVLFMFGTGLILGFATTLIIGILTSLFAAIFITRLILEYYIRNGKTLTFSSAWAKNLFADSNFDFVSRRKLYYTVSSVIIGLGIISAVFRGFGLGVDFKGGRSYVVRFEKAVSTDDVRNSLETVLGASPEVKTYGGTGIGSNQVKITTPFLVDDNSQGADKKAEATIYKGLSSIKGNPAQIQSSQKVGPTIAYDILTSALWSILLAVAVVFVYILIRFKRLAFGYGAVVAMFHDVLIILAIFTIFNGLLPFSLDVDQAFVGALLTIMGYSMNDTVVVFDRVREYLAENKGKKESIPTIINNALNSTLSRTAVTGFSTILVLLVLFIFGGETIRGFSFAMLIGVIVGTYSSLFVATPIVVDSLSRDELKEEPLKPVVTEKKVGYDAVPTEFTTSAAATPEEFTAKKEKKDKKPLIRPSQS